MYNELAKKEANKMRSIESSSIDSTFYNYKYEMTPFSNSLCSWRSLAHIVGSKVLKSVLKERNIPSLRAA
jgi:hypothetical protein